MVAIPAEDDPVWKYSSEPVPHLTMLYLGESSEVKNLGSIAGFVEHAAKTSLKRFGMNVDRRGTLGADQADVLFFSQFGIRELKDFRAQLLQDDNIRTAYDSVEQHDDWLPHLTMGYPDHPAKKDDRDYSGFNWVSFDRLALWFSDYEGFEYPLPSYDWDMEIAMSDGTVSTGAAAVEDIIHYGVKGMRWGVRRGEGTPTAVIVKDKGKKLKTEGGKGLPAHEDAVRARTIGQKGRASGTKALSNEELQAYATRLNLEQNVKRLEAGEVNGAKKFVAQLLLNTGKQQATRVANEKAAQKVDELLLKKRK